MPWHSIYFALCWILCGWMKVVPFSFLFFFLSWLFFVVRLLRFSAKSAVVACGCLPHICRSLVFGCVWFGSVLWCPYRREFRWLCCCLYAAGNRNSNHNIVFVIVIAIEIASCFPLINHSVILSTCFPISPISIAFYLWESVCVRYNGVSAGVGVNVSMSIVSIAST